MKFKRIPVTIITGFLGAGKTTLLNNILKANSGKRITVIENEFAAISIDRELIIPGTESVHDLSNGCICCSLNDELIDVLFAIFEHSNPPEHIIIETTGVADPTKIVTQFMSHPIVQMQFSVDSVICVADAARIQQQLARDVESVKQLAIADIVLLNKTDLQTEENLLHIEERILQINQTAEIVCTSYSQVGEKQLLGLDTFNKDRVLATDFKPIKERRFSVSTHQHDNISSHSIHFEGELSFPKFDYWLSKTLYDQGNHIYRMKGILSLHGVEKKFVFQSVHDQFMNDLGEPWGTQARTNSLVIIGRQIDFLKLEEDIKNCIYES